MRCRIKKPTVAKGSRARMDIDAQPTALDPVPPTPLYHIEAVIGKGSYGVVCAAREVQSGVKVAIKKMHGVFDCPSDAVRVLRELKLLRILKHPNLVSVYDVILPKDVQHFKEVSVVLELMEADLHTVLQENHLTPDHHCVFLYQMMQGLAHMHASGVLHRDLKPKNVLVNADCKVKLCDFGLARPLLHQRRTQTAVAWTDYVATRWYRAPELCGCFYGHYTPAVDIWSVGCIFAEIMSNGRPLFPGRNTVDQLQLITDLCGKPPAHVIDAIPNRRARAFLHAMPAKAPRDLAALFPAANAEALDLLRRLLEFDPAKRLTATEALAHPYFSRAPPTWMYAPASVTFEEFAFDLEPGVASSMSNIRTLIYAEALSYHPEMQRLLSSTNGAEYTYMMYLEQQMDRLARIHKLQDIVEQRAVFRAQSSDFDSASWAERKRTSPAAPDGQEAVAAPAQGAVQAAPRPPSTPPMQLHAGMHAAKPHAMAQCTCLACLPGLAVP